MSHKSRLACLVIDCRTDDLEEPLAFWSAALGLPGELDGNYAVLHGEDDQVRVLLQAVDHDPRVHLDIETDDKDAEVKRLTALGARPVARLERWTVMEAPTGHRFCVVNPQRKDFAARARTWDAGQGGQE